MLVFPLRGEYFGLALFAPKGLPVLSDSYLNQKNKTSLPLGCGVQEPGKCQGAIWGDLPEEEAALGSLLFLSRDYVIHVPRQSHWPH